MNKTILILAASVYQMETIRAAKNLGFRTVTTDCLPNNPGHALADRAYDIDVKDKESILEIAIIENINGIIAPCSDIAVPAAAYVAQKLGLNGVPLEAAQTLTEKFRFRNYAKSLHLEFPSFIRSDSIEFDIEKSGLSLPVIVKPNKSSGSKGIQIVRNTARFREALRSAIRHSIDGLAIIEEYISGTQHTCEGVLKDGKIAFSVITDRYTVPEPFVATSGHRIPSTLSDECRKIVLKTVQKALTSLKIRNCMFDSDFVVRENDSITILEITPRVGGNSLGKLMLYGMGLDINKVAIKQACRAYYSIPDNSINLPCAVVILGTERGGFLSFNKCASEEIRSNKNVMEFNLDYSCGDFIKPFTNGRDRVGEIVITSDSRKTLDEDINDLLAKLGMNVI